MTPDEVADIFAAFRRPVRCRRMFGGMGVYADGVMFALVSDGRLYLKADLAFSLDLRETGSEPFTYEARGKRVTLGFWSLPESALDDATAAAEFADRALRVALAVAATATPRRSRR